MAVGDDGGVKLSQWADQMKRLAGMVDRAGPKVAKALDAALKESLRAGTNPYGKKWKPTKQGNAPLKNAADNARVDYDKGPREVVYRIEGRSVNGKKAVYWYHHMGMGRVPKRQVIPEKRIPPKHADIITAVLEAEFEKTVST